MASITSYNPSGTTESNDTFTISKESTWISFTDGNGTSATAVDGKGGFDTFTLSDGGEISRFAVTDIGSGVIKIGSGASPVYLKNFEKVVYNSVTQWEATTVTNSAPTVTTLIADQAATAASVFAFTVPSNTFTDSDGNTLSYSATLSDGTALPSWLSFNPSTRAFSGTPTAAGTSSIKVTASDGSLSTFDTFNIAVSAVANHAPTIANLIADQAATAASVFAFTVPSNTFTDSDGNTLSYSATLSDSTALPSWLSFNPSTRAFSGTPTAAGTSSIKVTASDGSLSAYDYFIITVASAVVTPSDGNDAITGTIKANALYGYAGDDTLMGLAGNDTLDGGSGADTLSGGFGNDTYLVDNTGDVVTELAGQGTELVQSSISYTLTSNVEKLTLTDIASINGTGNELANTLTGNIGNNQLDGGSGNDKLIGGQGDDTYLIDRTGDKITEKLNEGTDTALVGITTANTKYTLAAHVENGTVTSSVNIRLTGNALNNLLTGNTSTDLLSGMAGNDTLNGGLGNDTLTGGAGSDTFHFEAAFSNTDFDTLTDFVSGTDKISLEASLVGPVGGTVDSTELWLKSTTSTQTFTQYLIYDKTSGILSYDADGSGFQAAVTIALVGAKTHPTLSYSDFVIV